MVAVAPSSSVEVDYEKIGNRHDYTTIMSRVPLELHDKAKRMLDIILKYRAYEDFQLYSIGTSRLFCCLFGIIGIMISFVFFANNWVCLAASGLGIYLAFLSFKRSKANHLRDIKNFAMDVRREMEKDFSAGEIANLRQYVEISAEFAESLQDITSAKPTTA
jgi:hypothetical protein